MKKKIIEYKKYILGVIGVLLILTMSVGIKYLMKPKYKELPEVKLVKLKDISNSKSFAIMVQNGDTYEEYNSDTWPGNGYNFKEAKCIDNKGDEIKEAVTYEEGKITLTTNKTIYCTVYFDYKGTINILRENEELANKDNLSKDEPGGMYRYQGLSDDVNNYICFGTNNRDECTNEITGIDKYMYRIIGITKEGQLYLIKETFIKEGNTTSFVYNNKNALIPTIDGVSHENTDYCDNGKCPKWNESLLFKRINGISNGNLSGKGLFSDKANTDIFIDNSYYNYLKSGDIKGVDKTIWYDLIENHSWLYGYTSDRDLINSCNGDEMFMVEHGLTSTKYNDNNLLENQYTWSERVDAKIGLMYLSDYYYSYYDGKDVNSRGNAGNYTNVFNSWIQSEKSSFRDSYSGEWTMTSCSTLDGRYEGAWAISYDKWSHAWSYAHDLHVRPVFYLESSTKIASGSGTKTDPYIIEI